MNDKSRICFRYRVFLALNIIIGFVVTGCSSGTKPSTLSTSTAVVIPNASPTLLPPTASLVPIRSCPEIDPNVQFAPPVNNNDIVNNVLSFLNDGGDINQINSYYSQYSSKTLDVLSIDLNEDNLKEVVLAGALPLELHADGDGGIYILGCNQKSYEIHKQFDTQYMSGARILRTDKLLAGYPQQVIIKYRLVAGWGSNILAIGYMNNEWRVIFEDTSLFPDFIIFDQDKDGNKEIAIHSITTATQGPQRTMITAFQWNGIRYEQISFLLMPGTTRVDYLDDAQAALDKGDISMAIAYYDRAAHDPNLGGFSSRGEIEKQQTELANDYQISFAFFRLAVLWFYVGDFETGSRLTEEFAEEFSTDSPGNEFTQATVVFRDALEQGKNPVEACGAVSRFLTDTFPYLNIHIGDWGMLVAEYDNIDELCPFN